MIGAIITLATIIYLMIGIWICWKREWYTPQGDGFIIGVAIVFMPLNLIIIIFKELIFGDWDN